jgi:hypothetical protein
MRATEVEAVRELALVSRQAIKRAVIGDVHVCGLLAEKARKASSINNKVSHIGSPGILIFYFGRFPETLALRLVITRYRHDVRAVLRQTSHHSAPEAILPVKLHQVRTDSPAHGHIRRRFCPAVTHDHVAVEKQKIRFLRLNGVDNSRPGLRVLQPNGVLP